MGTEDPRLYPALKEDFCIAHMLAAWKRQDSPNNCIKPIPISVIYQIAFAAQHLPQESEHLQSTTDMIIIALFFILCPGEDTDAPPTPLISPLAMYSLQLVIGSYL